MRAAMRQVKASRFTASCSAKKIGRRWNKNQPPPEKWAVKARANAPNPPRVTPPSEAAPELIAGSPPKKLLGDQYPPDPPWTPDEDPRGGHSSPDGAAIPGWLGSQFPRGISA